MVVGAAAFINNGCSSNIRWLGSMIRQGKLEGSAQHESL